MPVPLSTYLTPKAGQSYYLLEDKYLKGGFRVVANIEERDSILALNRKSGMMVLTSDDSKVWILNSDLTSWTQFAGGASTGARQIVSRLENIAANSSVEYSLELGASALILSLETNRDCLVEAFGTPYRDEPNPYAFKPTMDHLADDGAILFADGTTFMTRRYSIFANMESPPTNNIYFTISNLHDYAIGVELTITFLTLELVAELLND